MKIIIAPDKFKGSLTSLQVCEAIQQGLLQYGYKGSILTFPMADGGDGFSNVLQHYLKTKTIYCKTVDPLNRPMEGHYQWAENDKLAIIELAVASGIALLSQHELNPLQTSTYGTGLLIKDAILKGAKKIILGIGGSATNDAGLGILSALGFQFFNKEKKQVHNPAGGDLQLIKNIKNPEHLSAVEMQICCDVNNPFFGPKGAAHVYGPQKGANPAQVILLNSGLENYSSVLKDVTGKDIANVPGSGAAGGVAGGLLALLNAELIPGIEMVVEASGICNHLKEVSLVITGEGRIDDQSLQGKVVGTIAGLARQNNIPCLALCGKLDFTPNQINAAGLTAAYSIAPANTSLDDSIANAHQYLQSKVVEVIRSIASF